MPSVSSLGHIGIAVYDYPKMRDFDTRVLGMHVTDEAEDREMCLLTARPGEEHHELLLSGGRDTPDTMRLLGQISFHVDSIKDLREFHKLFIREGIRIRSVVSHGNTASIYCFDPEDNVVEVYFSIPVDWKQPFRADIDLSLDDEGVMLQISEATSGAVKL
jgi:catechol-2,3-dioxygenase